MTGKRWLRPALGLVVAGIFVYLAFGRLEWSSIRAVLRSARPGPLLLALAALAAGYTVRIIRWWWMLRALSPALPLSRCVRPFLVSFAVNNTMPLRAGDFVRAFGFQESLQSPPMRVLGTLVIERMLDLFVLLALFFVGLLGVARGAVPAPFVTAGVVLGIGCLCAILVLVFAPQKLQTVVMRVLEIRALRDRRWVGRARALAEQLLSSLALLTSPARALQLLVLSIVGWALEGGIFVSVAWALRTGGDALGPWFALATGTLATLLPSSPGYVGTFDYFTMLGVTAYGAAPARAAAFALLVHLIIWLPVTIAGALCLVGARGRVPWRGVPRGTDLP